MKTFAYFFYIAITFSKKSKHSIRNYTSDCICEIKNDKAVFFKIAI